MEKKSVVSKDDNDDMCVGLWSVEGELIEIGRVS